MIARRRISESVKSMLITFPYFFIKHFLRPVRSYFLQPTFSKDSLTNDAAMAPAKVLLT